MIPQDYLQLRPGPTHVYFAPATGSEFVSVTTKLHILSNPLFQTWRMNRALEFLDDHHDEITQSNKAEMFRAAKEYPETIFKNAGGLGTKTHAYAHQYFQDWLLYDKQPGSILSYIDGSRGGEKEADYQIWSALRSLEAWVNKVGYIPLASEIMLWSERYHVAGTMDNVGIINGKVGLADWKTSNNYNSDYWIQVGGYYGMFYELTKMRCHWGKIVKFDKNAGMPSEEPIDNLRKRFKTFVTVSKLYDEMQEIRQGRKGDNKVKL